MSSVASGTLDSTTAAGSLKRNFEDIGWEYGALVDPYNLDKVKCRLCGKIVSGGIFRLKCHVAHIRGHVKVCLKSSKEDRAKCKQSIEDARNAKKVRKEKEDNVREQVTIGGEEEEDTVIITEGGGGGVGASSSAPQKLGPMDKFANPIDFASHLGKELIQQNMSDALLKDRTHRVHQYIARWIYESGVPFNSINNDALSQMIQAIGIFGKGLVRPTQHVIRERLLQEEVEKTKYELKGHEKERLGRGFLGVKGGF